MIRRLALRCSAVVLTAVVGATLSTAMAQTEPRVRIDTDMGSFVIQLEAAKAPVTVANFLQYVQDGHYNGTVFHRVIPDFMIQGGGFTANMAQKPTRAPIVLESRTGLRNVRGTVAMARTMAPDSATAQFFVNIKDNDFLDAAQSRDGQGYAVFGRVVDGMEIIDRIRAVPTANRGMHQNVPQQPVTLLKATLEN